MPYTGEPWAFDNGAYGDFLRGKQFDEDAFLRRLEKAYRLGCPYMAVAPDIVAGGLRSLEFSLRWLEKLPSDWCWYLAVQDGMGLDDVDSVLDRFSGIFLGGTDHFKATALHWARLAHGRGKKFHFARAGTLRKVEFAKLVGADSLDSSFPLWTKERLRTFIEAVDMETNVLWGPDVWSISPESFTRGEQT